MLVKTAVFFLLISSLAHAEILKKITLEDPSVWSESDERKVSYNFANSDLISGPFMRIEVYGSPYGRDSVYYTTQVEGLKWGPERNSIVIEREGKLIECAKRFKSKTMFSSAKYRFSGCKMGVKFIHDPAHDVFGPTDTKVEITIELPPTAE